MLSKETKAYVLRCSRLRDFQDNSPGDITLQLAMLHDLQTYTLLTIEKRLGNNIMGHMLKYLSIERPDIFEMHTNGKKKYDRLDYYQVKHQDILLVKKLVAMAKNLKGGIGVHNVSYYHVLGWMMGVISVFEFFAIMVHTIMNGHHYAWYHLTFAIICNLACPPLTVFLAMLVHQLGDMRACSPWRDFAVLLETGLVNKIRLIHDDPRQIESLKNNLTYSPLSQNDLAALSDFVRMLKHPTIDASYLAARATHAMNILAGLLNKLCTDGCFVSVFDQPSFIPTKLNTRELKDVNPPHVTFIKEPKTLPTLKNCPPSMTNKQMAFSIFGRSRPAGHNDIWASPRYT
jgi:hypothetical protein